MATVLARHFVGALAVLLTATGTSFGQGLFIPSVGPTNQSFGGVAAAAPIDAIGALNWNPGSISGLRTSEVAFGLGLCLPTSSLESSIGGGAMAGSSDSEPGVCCIPTIGFTHRAQGSPWTVGLGIYGVGGFAANYEASTTNPITLPQATPPAVGGLGRIHAKAEICQVAPTISYALTDRLSFGIAPTLTLVALSADPFFLAPPDPTTGFYGPGNGIRSAFGGGFQLGTYYITDSEFRFGASYKSPQWMEPFRNRSQNSLGLPTFYEYNFDLPSIVTVGVAYSGFDRWLFATDVRYFDYANADGFGQAGFNPDFSVAGLGWDSIFSIANGVQFDVGPRLTLRAGYSWNENPISNSQTFFNVASSLIIQNWFSCGATFRWNSRVSSTLAYTHGFENTVTGPIVHPVMGPLPGTSVTERVSADILSAGVTVNF